MRLISESMSVDRSRRMTTENRKCQKPHKHVINPHPRTEKTGSGGDGGVREG